MIRVLTNGNERLLVRLRPEHAGKENVVAEGTEYRVVRMTEADKAVIGCLRFWAASDGGRPYLGIYE